MAPTRFLDRSARILIDRATEARRAERRGLRRARGALGGLALAVLVFFALKGGALAAGVALPGAEGWALWLAGPDPIARVIAATLEPLFARG